MKFLHCSLNLGDTLDMAGGIGGVQQLSILSFL